MPAKCVAWFRLVCCCEWKEQIVSYRVTYFGIVGTQATSAPDAVDSSSSPAIATDTSVQSQSPWEYTTGEEGGGESEDSVWNTDLRAGSDGFTEPISQLSQISQISQWSELSSTSNLDAVISFLETQDASETNRYCRSFALAEEEEEGRRRAVKSRADSVLLCVCVCVSESKHCRLNTPC